MAEDRRLAKRLAELGWERVLIEGGRQLLLAVGAKQT
jgi:riboflavin biosynthesis pyrimidine reductase